MNGVLFLIGVRDYSLLHVLQTGSGFHPPSYPMRNRGEKQEKNGRVVKLTTHLHLVPTS
jgi:hypothetical protein